MSQSEVEKLRERLELLRREYVKLQTRLNESERQNAILSAASNGGSWSFAGSKKGQSFVTELLRTVASLYNEKKYSDVTVQLKESEILAHKFILSIRNPSWGSDSLDTLDWKGMPQEVASSIVKWVYTNETDFLAADERGDDDSFALELMKRSKELELSDLMTKCEEALIASVQVHNCIRYFTTAEEIGAEVLMEHCSSLISAHWDDFTGKDFAHMTAPLLYSVLKTKTKYPLHSAIRLQREDVVFLHLIEFNTQLQTKLNEVDDKGCLPLDLALASGREDLAQSLVDNKVDVNRVDRQGSALLHNAVRRDDEAASLFLLTKGANPNVTNACNNDTPLHLAAVSKNMGLVAQNLIQLGANANAQNKDMKTPLHICIEHGNLPVFTQLLNSESLYLDVKSSEGFPPLWYALRGFGIVDDMREMAEQLAEKGAALNVMCDGDNNSLLHLCAAEGLEKAAQFVIGNGASLDVINSNGESPLHSAASGGLCDVSRTLLDRGADPNVQSHSKSSNPFGEEDGSPRDARCSRQTPVHIAVTNGNIELVRIMLFENSGRRIPINLNLKDSQGRTAFGLALSQKNFAIASELLKGGSDVNDADVNGTTLLHHSVSGKHGDVTRFLLENGVDPNIKSNDGQTALQLAVETKSTEAVEDLCRFGADMSLSSTCDPPLWIALDNEENDDSMATILVRHGVNTNLWVEGPDGCQQTLLHRAIDENRDAVSCFLIRAGCDVNATRRPGPNGEGSDEAHDLATPLHLCCQWGLEAVVETLLEHGASINAKDVEGKTPLHLAIENGQQAIVDRLLDQRSLDLCSRDKSGLSAFACAMTFKNQKAARRILQLEPSAADQLDTKGRNFLHTAILKDDLESVLFLLSIHAEVHSKTQDSYKLSPLLLAVTKGNVMIVRNLLLAGASLSDLSDSGQTALMIAADNGFAEICSVLLSNGVTYNAVDGRDCNALHGAVKEGHLGVVRVLLTESSIDAEAVNRKGRNPLHVLANFGKETSVDLFHLFVECMANYPINRPDAEGNTALLLAYMKGNGGLCRVLISAGAVLGTLNNHGVSIFNCQVASKQLLLKLLDFLSNEPKWGEGDFCEECVNKFGITNRKHHCRHCGRLLCNKCSDKEMPILKYGLSKPVRVCGTCADVLTIGVIPT